MHFYTSLLTVLASLAAMTEALPTPAQNNNNGLEKRIPCPPASPNAASADYKRDTTKDDDDDDDQGDDSPGAIIACNF
ncbi:hypothetical protein GGS20DRAFT_472724 [Poronia punctata]|nr:hypothetical protein GGS20DRAFT_472724 [Poronia punctata]